MDNSKSLNQIYSQAMVKDITFDQLVLESSLPVWIDFFAEWAGPCKQLVPIYEEIQQQYNGRISLLHLDVDQAPRTPQKYGVRGVPTGMLFLQGQFVEQVVGYVPSALIAKVLDKHLPPLNASTDARAPLTAVALIDGKVQCLSLLPDTLFTFEDQSKSIHHILYQLPREYFRLTDALKDFEMLLNDRSKNEQQFQEFFAEYPDFILEDDHRTAHAHLVLENETGGLIPDFMLEPFNSTKLCDVLEIKKPSGRIWVPKKNRPHFSSDVTEGIGQLVEYQRFFDDPKHRQAIKDKYGLLVYKPRMILILGRNENIDPFALKSSENLLHGVTIKTYDDLRERMKNRLQRYRGEAKKSN